MRLFIGIDPGLGGGVAFYWPEDPSKALVYSTPLTHNQIDGQALLSLVCEQRNRTDETAACIELVGSRPRQQGAFNFGFSTGMVHGVLQCAGVPIQQISPNKWKPALGLQRPPTETISENKDRARATASKLFPHLASQLTRKKDDGRAEALLIAFYAAHRKETPK